MVLIGEGNEGRRVSGDLVGLWGEEGGRQWRSYGAHWGRRVEDGGHLLVLGGRGGRSGDVMWLGWERGEEVVKI